MHLLVRETHSLDSEAAADDLGQSPADLVLLSFSDSDLGAAAAAWEAMGAGRPSLRLANLRRLLHPMSVDLYLEQVVASARCVVVRLLGGLGYWRYGVEEVAALCRARGIALALLPGDGRDDAALGSLSTVAPGQRAVLGEYLGQGGAENLRRALLLAAHLGGLGDDPGLPAVDLPMAGEFDLLSEPSPGRGLGEGGAVSCEFGFVGPGALTPTLSRGERGKAAIVFYRSHLQSGDIAPIEALASALAVRGLGVRAFYVASLKEQGGARFIAEQMLAWRPDVVLNATAFSAPMETGGAVVLQVVLAGSSREGWAASSRGLAGTDLAMHVALPELDGRLLTGAISFKREMAPVPGLEFARTVHAPCGCGIAMAAERATGWARLAQIRATGTAPVLGCVLSDYPGGGRVGHAVGLDTFASLNAMLGRMGATVSAAALVDGLCHATAQPTIDLATYRRLFDALPRSARAAVLAAWGDAELDPAVADGAFMHRFMRAGTALLAVQPDRGAAGDRKAGYHDPDCPPRHGFIAFYLWLRHVVGIDAMLHVGAHGTLEWLPGKSVALSRGCFPALLTGGVPVIYPFIVNNPGEAAAAKRRLGAVTLGHMTPPLRAAGGHTGLESLLDEYAGADGMDRRRTALLRRSILDLAETTGVLAESGVTPDLPEDDRLARLDAYLCDVKETQIRDGLHVFGDAPGEWEGLDAALAGRFVAPGPAGAPSRGRADVLPTGRNLYAIDPRAVPTPTAMILAERAAGELLRRHLQDQGEYPRSLVLNLWGSTTMRTGGEDLGLAMILLGVAPVRDDASGRVTGFEVVPLALLDRPRVDVTLRISGLFRDAFGAQIELFDAAVRAVAAREEAADWNPLAGVSGARVFGPAPGCYGAGVGAALEAGRWDDRGALGQAYLEASSTGYGRQAENGDFAAIARAADAFVLLQDHRETDLLEGSEFAAHTGGFAALADALGNAPALYHADTGVPDAPRVRTAAEEVARIVRGRAANPVWLAGMRRHGYRGATEIARAMEGLFGYAATLPHRFDAQFELLWAATLGDAEVDGFLREANPAAREGMAARFEEARARGLWHPKRNDLGVAA